MTSHQWRRVEELFSQAVELPAASRREFLDRVCEGDEALRGELNSLLACDAPEVPLLDASTLPTPEGLEGRARIGPYRLVRLLGRGGMGAVHLAVRDDDHFQKEVAIKLLKRGMDTDFMLAHFRRERQILANLEHPFIARLLDGGATDDGLPYFVMEYVDGLPISKYCAGFALSDRLRLFRLVCEAVQYAHQRLVVHRDIKPGNILVTREGVPKLLDFGIAKLANSDQTVTRRELRMMTPDYASPEQAKGLPIGTATDVYALGVLLYELSTEQRPHRFASDSPVEMERIICEVEPEKPSVAVRRTPGQASRSRQIAGDLDTIVLTAMHKEPQRRYPSVAELSEDVRRHLEGHPIIAREDALFYRTGKFMRRNKLGVAAAVLLALTLIGGMMATTIQARRAERRFRLVRELANFVSFDLYDQVERLPGSTSVQASMVETVARYLDRLAQDSAGEPTLDLEIAKTYFRVSALEGHPFGSNLGHTTLAMGHNQKAIEIFERLTRRSETRAEASRGLINAYRHAASIAVVLGQPGAAEAHLQKAVEIASRALSGINEQDANILASLYVDRGALASDRGDTETEMADMSKAVEVCRKWAAASPSPEALVSLRDAYSQLGKAHAHSGDLYRARDNYVLALQVAEQLRTSPDPGDRVKAGVVGIHHLFGDLLGATDDPNLGQPVEALVHYRAAAAVSEGIAARDPKNVNPRRNLAGSYRRIGLVLLETRPAEALEFYRRAVNISTVLSASEPANLHYRSALADGLLGLGQALYRLGRKGEALQNLGRALELQKSIEAAAPEQLWLLRSTSRTYLATGQVLLDQGDPERALAAYRDGLATAERSFYRFASSLSLGLDRAELIEALGAGYLTLATRSGASRSRRAEWRSEARSWYGKSLAIWQEWKARKAAIPYADRRISRTLAALASIERS